MSNSFVCDCNFKWLKAWLKNSNLAFGNPKCALPLVLKDRPLLNIDDSEFSCKEYGFEVNNKCQNSNTPSKFITQYVAKSVAIQSSTNTCPKRCTCTKHNIVRCKHLGLKEVPTDIPIDVKEL
jgi:hypothetical protein